MQTASMVNRRKEPRVQADGNIYVVLDTQPQMLGQMIEISSKGLAFTFVNLQGISQHLEQCNIVRLDLFKGGAGYFIRDLSCRLVSKINKQTPTAFSSFSIKRVGVEFEGLTLPQQIQINTLVKQQFRILEGTVQTSYLP
jgi:hypothetical protein